MEPLDTPPQISRHSSADPAPLSRPHLTYLDGLRGVAILMVLMVHSGQLVGGLPERVRDLAFYGVRGVQLFFIVSGLTLMLNYADRTFLILNFAARRFFRIAPMFYGGAILYLMLTATSNIPLPTRDATMGDIVATVLFVHGWLPHAINTVVPGGWSIGAEAMFYVAFPAITLVTRRRHGLTLLLMTSYLVAGVVNLTLRRMMPGIEGKTFALYFWVVQLPAFVGGCWLARLPTRDDLCQVARLVLLLGIAGLAIDSQLRGRSNLLTAIALLTLVTWAAGVVRPAILQSRILTLIGRISFSLYILQFAVLAALAPFAATPEATVGPFVALVAIFAAALAISGLLSLTTYRLIELPVIAATRRIGLPRAR